MSDTWTIGELAERAAEALRDGGAPAGAPVSGRVRDVPGERLIRWYTTIGLVDPPLARRGRVALYGRRHLLQLVAVKRLQAAGRSIAEIQAALAGAPDAALEAAADLAAPSAPAAFGQATPPVPAPAPLGQEASPAPAARSGLDSASPGRFWTRRPAGPGAENGAGRPGGPGAGDGGRAASANGALPREGLVFGIRLGDGVRLVLDAARAPSEEDVQAVLAAAGPLLAVLDERGLS
ncbi:MerR family transcriptional regulator [Nonomuraea pusilla]|uniref:MerR family transcriptional regulator n=1 Tax=Nonomuraea pusilla TaxID=46177 RepID=UPI00331EBCA8